VSRLQAVYYRDERGREPVRDYVRRVDPRGRVALRNQIRRLNLLTSAMPHLPFPYSSQIEGELRELRCHVGSELHRILYQRSQNLVVLLHAFRKTTAEVPRAEITLAQRRWDDVRARMDAQPRTPPRAAGHDAP
jgi:phage-related protein